jgi:hypothetical protein
MTNPVTPPVITCHSCDSTAIRLKKNITHPNIHDRTHYVKYCSECSDALTADVRSYQALKKRICAKRSVTGDSDDEPPSKVLRTMDCAAELAAIESIIDEHQVMLDKLQKKRRYILEQYINLA